MSAADTAQKKEAFARKLTDVLNYGALNLAMGMGYRTGLFDIMDAMDGAASGGLFYRYQDPKARIPGSMGRSAAFPGSIVR